MTTKTWEEEYQEKQEELRQLALLCLETRELTDDELKRIDEKQQEVFDYLYDRARFASGGAKRVLHARRRRSKLDEFSTEKLEAELKLMHEEHQRAIAADWMDDAPDSLYEAAPFDSDEYIIGKILEERKQKPATT